MKLVQSFLFLFLLSTIGYAQDYASIYIEGDGVTPFYVKIEGEMQERLAKDYFIIPNLDAGYTNIEILFQQNVYPAQHFFIAIPSSGTRGFALRKVNDQQFALYDLQQKRFIVSGNKKEDDWITENKSKQQEQQVVSKVDGSETLKSLPKFEGGKDKKEVKETKSEVVVKKEEDPQPQFIKGIELNSDKNQQDDYSDLDQSKVGSTTKSTVKRKRTGNTKEDIAELPVFKLDEDGNLIQPETPNLVRTDLPPVPNTDCPNAMDNEVFEGLAIQFLNKQDDDSKLKFLKENKKNHCFSTEQVRILGKNMDTQSGRFEEVKMLYIQTSDQESYGKLEELFNTEFLKSKFRELVKPKSN